MRPRADAERIEAFIRALGRYARASTRLYSQALSKLERGFDQDLEDVRAMIARGLVDPPRARELFEQIQSELFRFPAIDPAAFRARVERELAGGQDPASAGRG